MLMGELTGYLRTWSNEKLVEISSELTKCNTTRPSDLHRNIRNLDVIHHWKGTEFRVFLMYLGIVILKKHVSAEEYDLFKYLFCAVTICSSNVYRKYLPLARRLFLDFIENHISIYGESSITINIHNLSHVVDDVEHLGPLHSISAYEFENSLHHLKLRLKQCNHPLQQIARRISELDSSSKVTTWKPAFFSPKFDHPFVIGHYMAYKQVEFKQNVTISTHSANGKDKWFLTHDNIIVAFHFVLKHNENYIIRGSALKNIESFFQKPFDSNHLNIFMSDGELNDARNFELNSIKAKMFCLPYENKWVFIPLLHTL